MATTSGTAATSNPTIDHFYDKQTGSFTYVVADPSTLTAVIIDPVLDYEPSKCTIATTNADRVLSFVEEKDYRIAMILETHVHADHMTAASYLQRQLQKRQERPSLRIGMRLKKVQEIFAARYDVPKSEYENSFDKLFTDDEQFQIGKLAAQAIHVPGHTPDHMGYLIGDNIFVGDSLFHVDIGSARADFPGGDAIALWNSGRKILQLPDHVRVWSGHDYPSGGRIEPVCSSTVKEHKELNKHFGPSVKQEEFVQLREQRDATLNEPRLLHPSLQVNIRAGKLPTADAAGYRLMHLPVQLQQAEAW